MDDSVVVKQLLICISGVHSLKMNTASSSSGGRVEKPLTVDNYTVIQLGFGLHWPQSSARAYSTTRTKRDLSSPDSTSTSCWSQ